jgi:hypothetical protein
MMGVAEVRAGQKPKGGIGILERTVVRLTRSGRTVRCKIGAPGKTSRRNQDFALNLLEGSYLAMFLDEPLTPGAEPVTPRALLSAWFVLCDIADLLTADIRRTEIRDASDLRDLSAPMPASTLRVAIRDCLSISEEKAAIILDLLAADASDLGALFAHGLWHRPLIRRPGSTDLLLVLPVLSYGAPTRRVERWLVASGKADGLSSGSRGLAYEAEVRKTIGEALTENELLTDVAWAKDALKRDGEGEEIDTIFRIGSLVVVGEIKCFLVPSESNERYNHIAKLEGAADQARRKATWLADHPEALARALGETPANPAHISFLPLVILNHGIGMGLDIEGCLVTDAHFLKVYLSAGRYVASSLIGQNGELVPKWQRLYGSQQEAQDRIREVFAKPPGLTKFLPAVKWRLDPFPTSTGAPMLIPAYDIDENAMTTAEDRLKALQLQARGCKFQTR